MVFYCGTGSGSTGSRSTGSGSTGSGSTGPSLGWFYHRFRDFSHSHFQKRFNLKWKMPIKVFFFSFEPGTDGTVSPLERKSTLFNPYSLIRQD